MKSEIDNVITITVDISKGGRDVYPFLLIIYYLVFILTVVGVRNSAVSVGGKNCQI